MTKLIKILILPMCVTSAVGYSIALSFIGIHDLMLHTLIGVILGTFGMAAMLNL